MGALPDGLLLLGGALREVGRLGADRLRHPSELPPSAEATTARWMTGALQRDFPGARVAAVEVADAHAGTTARAALRVRYEARGEGEPPPERLFLKLPPRDVATRVFINLVRLGLNEVRFYRDVAPALAVERPACYLAEIEGSSQRFALLLEDLSARGARPWEVARGLDLERASSVLVELARLHAPLWASPRLEGDLSWLRAPGRGASVVTAFERALPAAALGTALRRHGDLVPEPVRAAARRIVASRQALEVAWGRGPLTVLHGDAHGSNLYLLPEGVGLLDWQLVQCGQGMRDVAYLLATSVQTAVRRAHEEELLRLYLEALDDCGAPPPTRDEAWSQYRLHALYAWQAAMFTVAAAGLQAEANALAGFRRSSAALADLESIAALDGVR